MSNNPIIRSALALSLTLCAPALGAAACPDPNSLAVIGGNELSDLDDLIERPVTSADGRTVGVVKDVVLDACGTPSTLIVALAHKDVAISIDRVRFEPEGEELFIAGLTQAAIAALPAVNGAAVSLDRR
ncbi:PRC-barrel domain-containing protein [Azospirillum sp. sgz301742]